MRPLIASLLCLALFACAAAPSAGAAAPWQQAAAYPFYAPLAQAAAPPPAAAGETARPGRDRSAIWAILMYVPNRVFDIVDILRLRARVGPGFGIGARVTTAAEVYLGSYVSVWAGLPGPRMEPQLPIPLGLESYNGAALSLAKGTFSGGMGPDYSPTECGASLHLLLIGLDLELDPIEVADFITGIIGIDIRKDDL